MFDVTSSINVSQPRRIQFVTEYFVDQEKYFFLILLHVNAAFCIGTIATIAAGTMLIGYLQFIFGMFKISCYRIERAIKILIPQNIILKNKILKSENLICAVDIHREAMRLSKYLVTSFEIMFLSLTGVFIISLCFNFLRIFQIASSGEAVREAFLPVIFIFANIMYLFICNFFGQNIIDHNSQVFITAYSVQWYLAPLNIQRMILFLLLKGAKDFTIIVGGILVSSIECFATLIKASISYFTVVLSMQ
ncbi:PREDICTED: odorant receptor 49b-like [Trachymyrmex cornetzi]|uniref:odorant receptor 49b-like n=1 Tax=Trachymyrmex cornetzi TaxID=471704 RepID=UPI00084EECEB|nr:PREDICTED: odorant receptor 49b-like [Trachymyrmex cornetzi]